VIVNYNNFSPSGQSRQSRAHRAVQHLLTIEGWDYDTDFRQVRSSSLSRVLRVTM